MRKRIICFVVLVIALSIGTYAFTTTKTAIPKYINLELLNQISYSISYNRFINVTILNNSTFTVYGINLNYQYFKITLSPQERTNLTLSYGINDIEGDFEVIGETEP